MDEAARLIEEIHPKRAILTHFGLQVLKANPELQAKSISERTGVDVMAARDGMSVNFEKKETLEWF
jgi:phosphoribosyl 1,2-cyclic phosphodiesterase